MLCLSICLLGNVSFLIFNICLLPFFPDKKVYSLYSTELQLFDIDKLEFFFDIP